MKTTHSIELSISATPAAVWRITGWLVGAVALLLALHIVALMAPGEMSITTLRYLLNDFNLDRENTLPAWFSSMLLLAAVLMLGIGVRARRRGERLARRWILIGVIFVLLSIDEAASFHELTIHPLRNHFHLSGIFYWSWVLPAIVMLTLLSVIYLPFVFALPARTRWGLIAAAVLYLSGTIGTEMVGGVIASDAGGTRTTAYAITITIEEMLELIGLVVLLHTLMMFAFVRHAAPKAAAETPGHREAALAEAL